MKRFCLTAQIAVVLLWTHAAVAAAAGALRIGTANFPENYGNPFNSVSVTYGTTYSALFDALTFLTNDGELLPWLALSWTQEAPTKWVIKLRPNVVFSNGEPFTSEAVTTVVAYIKSDVGQRDAVSRELRGIVRATARDALTVEIESAGPDVQLPRELSLLRMPAPGAWKKLGVAGFIKEPVGTGPYKLARRTPTIVTFAAVPTSWRKAPAPTLELTVAIDPAARRAALQTNRLDIVNTAVAPEEIPDVEALGGSVFSDKLPSSVAIALNNVKPGPLQDKRVRQALNYAVNKDAISTVMWAGRTAVASQMGPPSVFGFNKDVKPYPYDPAKAKALLKEAGYEKGFQFVFEGVVGTVIQSDVFQQVANDLAKVGVTMEIQMVPNAKFIESQMTGIWRGTAAALPYFSPTYDALYAMSSQVCTSPAPWFCDKDLTAAVEAARNATDLNARRTLTEKVMALSHDTALGIFLYDTVTFVGLGPRVKKFRQDAGFIRYEDIVLE